MELVFDYIRNDALRHQLNALTRKTFGFDFEKWVANGYYEGDYIPYSFVENGKMLSNVSANRMRFLQNGVERNYIQIGTVMTDEVHRNKGLARRLIEYVVAEYKDKCDGIYLFANLEALGFYRKTGFSEGVKEYRCTLKPNMITKAANGNAFIRAGEDMKQKYIASVRNAAPNAALDQLNRFGLQLFYTADMDSVFYAGDINCFAVMEQDGGALTLQSVICQSKISLRNVLPRITAEYDSLMLGFTPVAEDADMFDFAAYDGADDYRLFYIGDKLKSIGEQRLLFPEMSHA